MFKTTHQLWFQVGLKPHVDLLKLPHWGIPCVLDRSRSFGVFIRSFRKPEWWIDHDSPHVRCQYRIPIIAVAKITILVAWYPLPLASEECLYLEFGNIPIVACWNPLNKRGQTRVQTTCINMSWLTAITIYIHKNGQSICGFWRPSIWIYALS